MKHLTTAMAPLLRSAIVLLSLCLTLAGAAGAQVAKKNKVVGLNTGLKEMLQAEGATKLKKRTVTVGADQARTIQQAHGVDVAGTYTVYQGLDADDNLIGSVVVINQEGKEGPLQLMIALRPDGTLYDIGFTLFGEDKGKPALSWGFLKQYFGKTSRDPLQLGKDIDAVSSATITSTSVTEAVKKVLVVYDTFIRENP